MKIVVAHNAYQHRGGEDSVVESETALLRAHGHEVVEYRRHNDEIRALGALRTAAGTLWSTRTVEQVRALLTRFDADVIHVHNSFPLMSPSLHWAATRAGVPVVQTLHNFRLMCPQAMLLREGRICEDCVGRVPWPAVLHRCYRASAAQSAVLASMLMLHRGLGTWHHKVARYIALNTFCRDKFIEGGLPADRISIKPNFVDWPDAPPEQVRAGLLFVGRLAPEKGIGLMVQAAATLHGASVRVAGGGPEEALVRDVAGIQHLGPLGAQDVAAEMRRGLALLVPSLWYENFPRTLVEAFACGTPAIVSRLGALAGIVEDGVTGLHFTPGDATDLAAKMQWALAHPEAMRAMGRAARRLYEQRYSAAVNYAQLIDIYRQAGAAC